ncbi:DoxX family protein [Candidatus Peregrinibacteria bacterium]|nr:MAG: DoxX family protein [Candidatus Peregrinibacteria bacterium]
MNHIHGELFRVLKIGKPYVLSVYRFILGFLFIEHGFQKIFGLLGSRMQPEPLTLMWTAGMLELVGGILLMVGLFTRSTAFILSGFMAVAYFMVHASSGFWPVMNKGEVAALYSFSFFLLIFLGGGRWSIDALFCKKSACCCEGKKEK